MAMPPSMKKRITIAPANPITFSPRPTDPTGSASTSVAAGASARPATQNTNTGHPPGGLRHTSTVPAAPAPSYSRGHEGQGTTPAAPAPSYSKGHEGQSASSPAPVPTPRQKPNQITAVNGAKAKPKVVKRYKVGPGPKPAATNRVSRASAQLAYRQSLGGGPSRRQDEKNH